MHTENSTLIDALLVLAAEATAAATRFRKLPESQLNYKSSPESWSVLECIEHLNRYGEYYLPELEKAILSHDRKVFSPVYRSGLLGNYFANLMKVKDGKMTKMKTPPDKNPAGSKLTVITLDRFLKQQEMLTSLLDRARHTDLTGIKVPISLTKLVKLRLGDTFRFFVYHIERHIFQAEKALENSVEPSNHPLSR